MITRLGGTSVLLFLRLKDAIGYFGIQSHFFMMLDDIGSGITYFSKSNDAKIQTKDGTSIFGFLFHAGNKNENSALIKLETVNTSPHGYNRQALRLSVRIEW